MTTDAPGDMIRMQNPNQAKRCPPEMAGAAIFIPERRIPSHTLLSFACGITAAPRKAEVLQLGMKPEEIFRLSGFTKDEFLNMMTKGHDTYSKAQVIRSV